MLLHEIVNFLPCLNLCVWNFLLSMTRVLIDVWDLLSLSVRNLRGGVDKNYGRVITSSGKESEKHVYICMYIHILFQIPE